MGALGAHVYLRRAAHSVVNVEGLVYTGFLNETLTLTDPRVTDFFDRSCSVENIFFAILPARPIFCFNRRIARHRRFDWKFSSGKRRALADLVERICGN